MMSVMSSVGRPTEVSTITMVTRPAWGMPAAPTLAAVAVILHREKGHRDAGREREKWRSVRRDTKEGKGSDPQNKEQIQSDFYQKPMQRYPLVFYWDLAGVSSYDGHLNSSYCRCKSSCFVCLFVLKLSCCCCLVAQSCLTLCNPMDCCPQGSSLHGISQARILEWVAISFSRGSSRPRNQTPISCIGRQILYHGATRYTP